MKANILQKAPLVYVIRVGTCVDVCVCVCV